MASAGSAFAGTINFNNMPQQYWYYGGHQNFGTYWAGVDFGPDATILEEDVYGYSSGGYPPVAGSDAVLFSFSTPYITASFATPVDTVSIVYTNGSGNFTFSAYDSSNNLLDQDVVGTNYGTNSLLTITDGTSDISWVEMSGIGNFFTIASFSTPDTTGLPSNAPDATSTLALLGVAALALFGFRRKLASALV